MTRTRCEDAVPAVRRRAPQGVRGAPPISPRSGVPARRMRPSAAPRWAPRAARQITAVLVLSHPARPPATARRGARWWFRRSAPLDDAHLGPTRSVAQRRLRPRGTIVTAWLEICGRRGADERRRGARSGQLKPGLRPAARTSTWRLRARGAGPQAGGQGEWLCPWLPGLCTRAECSALPEGDRTCPPCDVRDESPREAGGSRQLVGREMSYP
jgi:hypothetical protein